MTVDAGSGTDPLKNYSVTYGGYTYFESYKINSSGTVSFQVPNYAVNVTVGLVLRNDKTYTNEDYIVVNSTNINLGITTDFQPDNQSTYQLVTFSTSSAGTVKISNGSKEVGLFYVKIEPRNSSKSNSVTLEGYNLNGDPTLGLWRSFEKNGMTLYLGGWKYQTNSKLADKYTMHSDEYYDPDYDPEYDYENDKDKDPTTKQDDWEAPETQYQFGTEDPYYYTNNCILNSNGKFDTDRDVAQEPYSGYSRYSYNTVDNGRNEYIEQGYNGRYKKLELENAYTTNRTKGDPFTVPCFGDFIKLEPDYDGTVTLYLMQNGTLDYNVKNYRKNERAEDRFSIATGLFTQTTYGKWHGGLLSKVCWRPLYIVDEAGTHLGENEDGVTATTETWITIGRGDKEAYVYDFDDQGAVLCPKDGNGNYYTNSNAYKGNPKGYITTGLGNNDVGTVYTNYIGTPVEVVRHTFADCFEQLNDLTDIKGKAKSEKEIKDDQAHYRFFISKYKQNTDGSLTRDDDNGNIAVWPERVTTTGPGGTGAKARVWGPQYTGDGWIVISKGYVKYTFNVKAGKSYYIFSNDTKVGFCGYEFEKGNTSTATLSLRDDGNGGDRLPNETKTYKTVTLTGRTFQKGWNPICLPFSVTESKMREWFGTKDKETYELVTYNGLSKSGANAKAHFFRHVYQDIIAGYPYMLYIPEGAKALDENWKGKVYFENVTVEPNATPIHPFTSSTDYMPDNHRLASLATEKDYTFVGFYDTYTLKAESYYVVPKGLQLYTGNGQEYRGYRAVLRPTANAEGAKEMVRITSTNFTNIVDEMEEAWKDATVINQLAEEMGFFNQPQNVYSVSGQLVRANSTSLAGLPKGIYIVNGKKYLVTE